MNIKQQNLGTNIRFTGFSKGSELTKSVKGIIYMLSKLPFADNKFLTRKPGPNCKVGQDYEYY